VVVLLVVIVTVLLVFANAKPVGLVVPVQDAMAKPELLDIVHLVLLLNAQFVPTRPLNVVVPPEVNVTRPLVNALARLLGLVVHAVTETERLEHLLTTNGPLLLYPLLQRTMLCAPFAPTKDRSAVVLPEALVTETLVPAYVKTVGLAVLVQVAMVNLGHLDIKFLALPELLNVQFVHTRGKNVVVLLVERVTLKLVSVLAKLPSLVELVATGLVVLELLGTTYLKLPPK